MTSEEVGKARSVRLYNCLRQQKWRDRKSKRLHMIEESSSSEESTRWDSADLTEEVKKKRRNEKIRKKKVKLFNKFRQQLMLPESKKFRMAIRPKQENTNVMTVPNNQIGDTWVLSQSPFQRKVVTDCTKISVDNNHKTGPPFAERTITMRGLYKSKEWLTIGEAVCVDKKESTHKDLYHCFVSKTVEENPTKIISIKGCPTDFEIAIKETRNRIEEFKNGAEYKQKNKSCLKKDKIISGLVRKHKTGQISTDEYWRRVCKVNQDYDLPGLIGSNSMCIVTGLKF